MAEAFKRVVERFRRNVVEKVKEPEEFDADTYIRKHYVDEAEAKALLGLMRIKEEHPYIREEVIKELKERLPGLLKSEGDHRFNYLEEALRLGKVKVLKASPVPFESGVPTEVYQKHIDTEKLGKKTIVVVKPRFGDFAEWLGVDSVHIVVPWTYHENFSSEEVVNKVVQDVIEHFRDGKKVIAFGWHLDPEVAKHYIERALPRKR